MPGYQCTACDRIELFPDDIEEAEREADLLGWRVTEEELVLCPACARRLSPLRLHRLWFEP